MTNGEVLCRLCDCLGIDAQAFLVVDAAIAAGPHSAWNAMDADAECGCVRAAEWLYHYVHFARQPPGAGYWHGVERLLRDSGGPAGLTVDELFSPKGRQALRPARVSKM
jgi:hypothetical protein